MHRDITHIVVENFASWKVMSWVGIVLHLWLIKGVGMSFDISGYVVISNIRISILTNW